MTPRKPCNADAIGHPDAAQILGVAAGKIPKLIRDGLLDRVAAQFLSLSRRQVEEHARNPRLTEWVNALETARILGRQSLRGAAHRPRGLDVLTTEVGDGGSA